MVSRTRRDIIRAFDDLINRKPFDEISVEDILKKSGVSRSTFYRYFRDKWDVMNTHYKDIVDNTLDEQECRNFYDLFYHLIYEGELFLRSVKGIFSSGGQNSFTDFLYRYSFEKGEEIIKASRGGRGYTPVESVQMDFFCTGMSNFVNSWFAGKYSISIQEATDALFEMFPLSLRNEWPEQQ
jgi:AcrR family transcriptional regulator